MVFIKKEESGTLDNISSDKQEDVFCYNESGQVIYQYSEDDDSRTGTISLSEEAMAWDGKDMQHLEIIFTYMRSRFAYVNYDPEQDFYGQNFWDPQTYLQSTPDKCDLLDACCYFLEHEKLPRIHQARANLMMVWLIETETESARYADIADEIIEEMESSVLQIFGVKDERVEELKRELLAAHEEVVKRTVEGDEVDVDEDDDDDDDDGEAEYEEEYPEEYGEQEEMMMD